MGVVQFGEAHPKCREIHGETIHGRLTRDCRRWILVPSIRAGSQMGLRQTCLISLRAVEPLEDDQRVIDAAEALARRLGDNDNHTVAAAVMDIDGRVHEAVNVYHFTGGPCAELVVLGVAATSGAKQLLTIAAAGDRGRGLISPCGRCRQVLLDQHPDILVAVPTENDPVMRPIRKLLPDTYFYPDAPDGQIVRFNRRYHDEVMSGEKTSTIRWDEEWLAVGQATFVFEGHPQFAHVDGAITAVEATTLTALDPGHAAGLRGHYPAMPDDAKLLRVEFRVDLHGT
ncbi:hypothetical protein [Microbacterium faecale]|uniref:hypothetical protein n=1 Tax=Microbacterium faecale TaxID=1804630 RepID=UPI001E4152F5|nr:hypothetical protein [Microbacterium faecale]